MQTEAITCEHCGVTRRPPTKREQALLDLLVEGHSLTDIARMLHITHETVKIRLQQLYAYYGMDTKNKLGYILLAVQETYRRQKELIPFSDGDRAQQINKIPAELHARIAIGIDQRKKSWKSVAKDVTHKAEQMNEFAEMSVPPNQCT